MSGHFRAFAFGLPVFLAIYAAIWMVGNVPNAAYFVALVAGVAAIYIAGRVIEALR